MVVDDDLYGLAFFRTSLRMLGYRVTSSETAEEAMDLLQNESFASFDAILTDFRMPKVTGLDLLKWIQKHDPTLSTVIVTAEGEKNLVRDSLRGGAVDFLEKPVAYPLLEEAMGKAVRQTRRQRQLRANEQGLREASRLGQIFVAVQAPELESRIKLFMEPLQEVGGDFLNLLKLEEKRFLVVAGDVSGHNIRAAFVSAYFQGMVRALKEVHQLDPRQVLSLCNDVLCQEWNPSGERSLSQPGVSLAVTIALLDFAEDSVNLISCGNPPVLIQMKGGRLQFTRNQNPPLGWIAGHDFVGEHYRLSQIVRLYFCSDGITDLADEIEVDVCCLLSILLGKQDRRRQSNWPPATDDLFAMSLSLSEMEADDASFHPIISEQYGGHEFAMIDRFQEIWRRSLLFALGEAVEERLYELLLCCREGVLNALVHGCDRSAEKTASLSVSHDAARNRLRVRIDDPGRGHHFDLQKRLEALGSFDGRHLGLTLIHDLSDRFQTGNAGSSIVFDFDLNHTPPA